jgi:hypothetical protein
VLACADVVGYSRLMDADEAGTLARITLTVRHCHRNFDRSQQARHSFFDHLVDGRKQPLRKFLAECLGGLAPKV